MRWKLDLGSLEGVSHSWGPLNYTTSMPVWLCFSILDQVYSCVHARKCMILAAKSVHTEISAYIYNASVHTTQSSKLEIQPNI